MKPLPGFPRDYLAIKTPAGTRPVLAFADAAGTVTASGSINYAQIKRDLDAIEAKGLKALLAVLLEMRGFLAAKFRGPTTNSDIVRNLDFSQRVRRDLRRAFRELLQRAWDAGRRDARGEIRAGKADVRKHDTSSFTPTEALRWLDDKSFWLSGVVGDKVLADAKAVLINGMKTGKSTSDMVNGLADVFAPYVGNPNVVQDGEALSPFRLETTVRTNTTEAYNHGRLTTFTDPDVIDLLEGVMFQAILDERTTEVCRFLDGMVFDPGGADIEDLLPPLHFNCRSIVTPVVVGQEVDAADFITPEEIGTAKGLADASFLSHIGAWKNYVETHENAA